MCSLNYLGYQVVLKTCICFQKEWILFLEAVQLTKVIMYYFCTINVFGVVNIIMYQKCVYSGVIRSSLNVDRREPQICLTLLHMCQLPLLELILYVVFQKIRYLKQFHIFMVFSKMSRRLRIPIWNCFFFFFHL